MRPQCYSEDNNEDLPSRRLWWPHVTVQWSEVPRTPYQSTPYCDLIDGIDGIVRLFDTNQ